MRVLITGGGGFFGSAIVQKFLGHGDHLTIISRSKPNAVHLGISYYYADITRPKTLQNIKGTYDVLVHSAAHMPKSPKADDPRMLVKTNILGTLNVMERLAPYAKKIIYVSSIDVYGGIQRGNNPLTESSETTPRSYYGVSKLSGEQISQIYCQKQHIPLTILRFTVLYGPGDVIDRAIPNFIQHAIAGTPLIVPRIKILRDYLAIREAARAVYVAALSPKNGTYIIGSGKSFDVKKVAKTIHARIRSKSPIISKSSGQAQFQVLLNVQKAQKDFHFTPRPFPFGLEETAGWYKARLRK